MDPTDKLRDSREKLKAGQAEDAYRALLGLFNDIGEPLQDDASFRDAVSLLAELSNAFGDVALAEKVAAAAARADDPQALYDAAYGLYEQKQFAAAATLLFRANRRAPGQPAIVTELSGCLEKLLRYREAALILEQSKLPEHDAVCAYLSGFAWLMSGDLEVPRRRVAALAGNEDGPIPFMRAALGGMLARADALLAAGVELGDRALTAWQAVIDGTVLLHESPHGYEDAMRGRYAYLADSPALVREGAERLKAVLAAAGQPVKRVVAAPGRPSRIAGLAASRVLGVPAVDWSPGAEQDSLVVAWTMESVEDADFLAALQAHAPGQRLFVHASCWTQPFPYAPDVTTCLYQAITNPWTGGALRVDPETRKVTRAEPDARSDGELVDEVLRVELSDAPDASVSALEHVNAIVRALASVPEPFRAGIDRSDGRRLHQRAGSPVDSNRFL